mgnify:CR=1 FL=1|tara:strand:- start:63247 stop:63876 length:630 start_codon:yes stop_codon:yes gene_type:complete
MRNFRSDYRDARRQLDERDNLTDRPMPASMLRQAEKEEMRRLKREREIPRDRRCPRCQEIVLESNRWVVIRSRFKECRKCYALRDVPEDWEFDPSCLVEHDVKYRLKRGTKTAAPPGWAKSKLSKVRAGDQTVTRAELRRLKPAVEQVITLTRYRDEGQQLRYARMSVGLTKERLGPRVGIPASRLKLIEAGAPVGRVELLALLGELSL